MNDVHPFIMQYEVSLGSTLVLFRPRAHASHNSWFGGNYIFVVKFIYPNFLKTKYCGQHGSAVNIAAKSSLNLTHVAWEIDVRHSWQENTFWEDLNLLSYLCKLFKHFTVYWDVELMPTDGRWCRTYNQLSAFLSAFSHLQLIQNSSVGVIVTSEF